jgi:hypothetical protein
MSVRQILKVYRSATSDEIEFGMKWYAIAKRDATKIAKEFGISINTTVGVIAALSPNLGWNLNVRAARDLIGAFTSGRNIDDVIVSAYPANKRKAWDMLEQKIVRKKALMSKLNGRKTTAFFANIIGLDVVTVDGHAKNIHDGLRRVLKNNNVGVKEYGIIADAYYKAADTVGIKGYQMQAITWVAWRRQHNIAR